MTEGPLIDGIAVLGPGDTRDTTWGQFGGLMKAVGAEPIEVGFTYKYGRRTLRGHSRLEVASYIGTDDSENPQVKAAAALDTISKAVETIAKELERPHSEKQGRLYSWMRLRDQLQSANTDDTTRTTTDAQKAAARQEETKPDHHRHQKRDPRNV